jgi:hypothetical protein
MTKNFKIARKPGQGNAVINTSAITAAPVEPATKKPAAAKQGTPQPAAKAEVGQTTRKTIEVPEEYFYQVKLRALERRMLEKELWAEILEEYFSNHLTI